VPKHVIQSVNKFSGEDIYYMKELLIPYKGQTIVQKPQVSSEKQLEEHRLIQVFVLAENIKIIEKKKKE
jgi:hypothetical protein